MSTPFDLSQFEAQPMQQAENTPERLQSDELFQERPENEVNFNLPGHEPFDLSQFEAKEEGNIESGLRQTGQYGLRGLEMFLGLPGSLNNLIATGIEKGSEAIAGEELPGLRKNVQKFKETGKTPEYFREKGKNVLGEAFEPQSKQEEKIGEIASDVGAFLSPIGGGMSFAKAIGLSLAGAGAKETAKIFTQSEGKQDAAKLGAMFITDLMMRRIGGSTARNFINGLYETEREMVPQGTRTVATNLEDTTNRILHDLGQSNVNTSSSRLVRNTAEELLSDVQNGTADVRGLLLAKRRLNELRGDPALLRGEEPILNELSREVENTIQNYGRSPIANQEFNHYHTSANEAFSTLARSRTISNFVGRHLPKTVSHFIGGLFGEAITGHAALIPGTIAGAVGLTAAVKSGELLYRVMASPALRGYYTDVLTAAAAGNAGAVTRNVSKLDKAIKKDKSIQEDFG